MRTKSIKLGERELPIVPLTCSRADRQLLREVSEFIRNEQTTEMDVLDRICVLVVDRMVMAGVTQEDAEKALGEVTLAELGSFKAALGLDLF